MFKPGISLAVELVSERRVAQRPAAQRLPANPADRASCSAAPRACAAEATGLMRYAGNTPFEELLRGDIASAPLRRGGFVGCAAFEQRSAGSTRSCVVAHLLIPPLRPNFSHFSSH